MDELINILSYEGGQGDYLSNMEVGCALALSAACSTVIAMVYQRTHKSAGYSQSYVQSLLLLGLITTLIMVVIGSNIARAFSLVGALSIVRFRNAIKETRDVAFIFLVMAVAMACGTRFYAVAMLATFVNCLAILAMHVTNFGSSKISPERLIAIQLPGGAEVSSVLEPAMSKLFQTFSLVSMENVRQGLYLEATYSVRPFEQVTATQVIDEVSRVNNNLKIRYNNAAHVDDL